MVFIDLSTFSIQGRTGLPFINISAAGVVGSDHLQEAHDVQLETSNGGHQLMVTLDRGRDVQLLTECS
jgi:hypothetical protein